MTTEGILALDTLLPAAKARLGRELLLRGLPLTPAAYRRRGLDLSPGEQQALQTFEREGLATRVVSRHASRDGSVRLVLALGDGERVEAVAMPVGAACVSTQVGCAVGCLFCASGLDGLRRNLSTAEIVEQVVWARRELRIDRVVLMGIGEPTHNLAAVQEALAVLAGAGRIGRKRLTLSTVGSPQAFARLAAGEVQPCLALSLHAADDALRQRLLPRAPRVPVRELLAAADAYGRGMGMPLQIEWTVLRGVNDRDQDLEGLCALLHGVRGYVNFIVWNAVHGLPFAPPDRARVVAMVRAVKSQGILATIRDSAGTDVEAACGQLRRSRSVGAGV